MRSSGAPSVKSPMTSASAVSERRGSFEISRSYPMASNNPHLVGMRVDAMRQSGPVCADFIALALANNYRIRSRLVRSLRRAFLGFGSGTARAQAVDFARGEAEQFENLLSVLAKCRRAPCGHFG